MLNVENVTVLFQVSIFFLLFIFFFLNELTVRATDRIYVQIYFDFKARLKLLLGLQEMTLIVVSNKPLINAISQLQEPIILSGFI